MLHINGHVQLSIPVNLATVSAMWSPSGIDSIAGGCFAEKPGKDYKSYHTLTD